MTSGVKSGANGWSRDDWAPWLLIALAALVVISVNASSDYMEMTRAGRVFAWWEPVVWEATSGLVIVAMAPLVGLAVRRWRPTRETLFRPLLIHAALTIPFAAAHIAGIWLLRGAVYGIAHTPYGYFDDGVALVAFYEWRKDVLTYATIAGLYWLYDVLKQREVPKRQAAPDARIDVRDGGATMFLAPGDITHVEAAGNYVEIHTGAKTHLVRGALAAWEARLAGHGFVRVHRSRLVNRNQIALVKPTPAGDVEIALKDGRTLAGSRRFRAALEG